MKVASILTAFALFAIACTTTTTTTTPAPSGDDEDAGAKKNDKDAGKSTDDDDDDEPAGSCEGETGQACLQCCAGEHQKGATVYINAVNECICAASACADDCADTFCAADPKDADTKCNECFDANEQSCGQAVRTACDAEPDCVAFETCVVDSGCVQE